MAASTARRYDIKAVSIQKLSRKLAAAIRVFQGTILASDSNGYVQQMADSDGFTLAGKSLADADNRSGSAGDVEVEIQPPEVLTAYELDAVNPIESWLDRTVYFSDDHTVALSSTYSVVAGKCVAITKTGTTGRVVVVPVR